MKISIDQVANSPAAKGYYDPLAAGMVVHVFDRNHRPSLSPRLLEVRRDRTVLTDLRPGDIGVAMDGYSPITGRAIASNSGRLRRAATDFTVSLDKSLSALRRAATLAGDESTAALIDEAVGQSVRSMWRHVLGLRLVTARAGAQGWNLQPTTVLYVIDIPHDVSRTGDPQEHRHNLVLNAGWHPEKGLCTVEMSLLVEHKLYLELCLASELLGRLRAVGIPCETSGPARLRIVGMPITLADAWSTRRRQILSGTARTVPATPIGRTATADTTIGPLGVRRRREAKERAAMSNRADKSQLPDEAELRLRHAGDLASLGLTPFSLVQQVMTTTLPCLSPTPIWDEAALFGNSSVASMRAVRTHVATFAGQRGATMDAIDEAAHRCVEDLILLGVNRQGAAVFSTPSVIADERQLLCMLIGDTQDVNPATARTGEWPDRPGTPKGDASHHAVHINAQEAASAFLDRCAEGRVPAAGTGVVLSDDGTLDRGAVVAVAIACLRHTLRLSTSGTGGHHGTYLASLSPWRSSGESDGFATPVAAWQRHAQSHLRHHDCPALLAEYGRHGRWRFAGGVDLVGEITGNLGACVVAGIRPLLLAEDHEVVHRLNAGARAALGARGLLRPGSVSIHTWHLCGSRFEPRRLDLGPGEPVMLWPGGQAQRAWPQAGSLCTVAAIHRRDGHAQVHLQIVGGRTVNVEIPDTRGGGPSPEHSVRLQHAYAIPLHSAQDHHADFVIVYGGSGLDRTATRLALTRHRVDAFIYWDRPEIERHLSDQGTLPVRKVQQGHILTTAAIDRHPTSVSAFAEDFTQWLASGTLTVSPPYTRMPERRSPVPDLAAMAVLGNATTLAKVLTREGIDRHAAMAAARTPSGAPRRIGWFERLLQEASIEPRLLADRLEGAVKARGSRRSKIHLDPDIEVCSAWKTSLLALARPGGVAAAQGIADTVMHASSGRKGNAAKRTSNQFPGDLNQQRRALDRILPGVLAAISRVVSCTTPGVHPHADARSAYAWSRIDPPTGTISRAGRSLIPRPRRMLPHIRPLISAPVLGRTGLSNSSTWRARALDADGPDAHGSNPTSKDAARAS